VGRLLPTTPDVVSLRSALEHILTDSGTRARLSSNAKSRGRRFSAKKMCEETFKLYESIT
jgi:glycosyltransferase involved in cell wall biosynthesis